MSTSYIKTLNDYPWCSTQRMATVNSLTMNFSYEWNYTILSHLSKILCALQTLLKSWKRRSNKAPTNSNASRPNCTRLIDRSLVSLLLCQLLLIVSIRACAFLHCIHPSLTSNSSHRKPIIKSQRERSYMKQIRTEKTKCKLSWKMVFLWNENMLIEKEILELRRRRTKKSENLVRSGRPITLLSTSFSTNSEDWRFHKSLSCKPIRLTRIFWNVLINN